MAAESEPTVSRLDIEGSTQSLFVWTKYDGDLLSLKVSDGVCTWQGTLCHEQLHVMADCSKMTLSSFLDETLKAFSRKDMGNLTFVYSIKHCDASAIELAWKKHLISDGIKFQLGSIDLVPAPPQSTHNLLLNHSIDCTEVLRHKIDQYEGKCERLIKERQIALDHLQKCSSCKEDTETELYSKFKLILNEKKSKIRKLMECKTHLIEQNDELHRGVWDVKNKASTSLTTRESVTRQPSNTNTIRVEELTSKSKYGANGESLLSGASYKPRSPPPPAKRQRLNKCTGKGQIEIPRPPLVTSKMHDTKNPSTDKNDVSIDSNELLDML